MKFNQFKETITEGVYDPGIFKAFFLAGGAGSGKSYSAEKVTGSAAGKFEWHDSMKKLKPGKVGPFGLKVVNSDEQLEYGLMQAEMPANMKQYSPADIDKKEEIRGRAKEITKKREALWVDGRLGLIIDGTAKDPRKLSIKKKKLEDIGYDTYMIFVNTNLDIALQQNSERKRVLPDEIVIQTWEEVQQIKGELANIFQRGFIEVTNNRAGEDVFRKAFGEVSKLIKTPPKSSRAKAWMSQELEKKKR